MDGLESCRADEMHTDCRFLMRIHRLAFWAIDYANYLYDIVITFGYQISSIKTYTTSRSLNNNKCVPAWDRFVFMW